MTDISKDLYAEISRIMPIPCVDLLVTDEEGRVLLLRRKNEPMKNEWWFPGGRVFFMETRTDAVARKLKEECNLEVLWMAELGTYDLIHKTPGGDTQRHWITTLYHVRAGQPELLKLDGQSAEAEWHSTQEWKKRNLHQFVDLCLGNYDSTMEKRAAPVEK